MKTKKQLKVYEAPSIMLIQKGACYLLAGSGSGLPKGGITTPGEGQGDGGGGLAKPNQNFNIWDDEDDSESYSTSKRPNFWE